MPDPIPTNRSARTSRPARPAVANRRPEPVVVRQAGNPPAVPTPGTGTSIVRGGAALVVLGFISILLIAAIAGLINPERSDSSPRSMYEGQAGSAQPTLTPTAYEQLLQQVALDNESVRINLTGRWVPQLASARLGLVVDGVVFDYSDILNEHLNIRQSYPEALLLWSGDWSSFSGNDFFVTVLGVPYSTGEQANGWCDSQGIDGDHCFAKFLSNTTSYEESTRHR